MDTSNYTTLTRQSGLMREMQIIANNVANAATSGYRQEGVMFSEYLVPTGSDDVSMAHANLSRTDFRQGSLAPTGNAFDLAIQGNGYFTIDTPLGQRLTRNGAFTAMSSGQLVTNDGFPVLDTGGSPVFIPPDAPNIAIGGDGVISAGDQILGQISVVYPTDDAQLIREDGVRFQAIGELEFPENAKIVQGFLEKSNTDPVQQMARMIMVQRAYEMGQSFQDSEDKRLRSLTQAIST
ncbi:flagellar hook-basal body complex protein [Rhodobacteraceae bacterium]|nr:flagellar hook-basal body complex protein [Paracoccaceae bacterium]